MSGRIGIGSILAESEKAQPGFSRTNCELMARIRARPIWT